MMLGQGYGYQPGAMGVDFEQHDVFYDRAQYEYVWCLWPRRCYLTQKKLWLTWALRGRSVWTGPGDAVVEDRWFDRDQALIMFMRRCK